MIEFPEDIKKDAEEAVTGFMGWIEGGNTTASLSEHAVAGLKHSFASAILAERERCATVAKNWKRKRLGRDLKKATFDPCGRWEGGEIYEEGKERDLISVAILKGGAA